MIPVKELFRKVDKPFNTRVPHRVRVMTFDPLPLVPIIEKFGQRTTRYCNVPLPLLFPQVEGVCCCGCGTPLSGRRKRYASDDCRKFCEAVWGIIACHNGTLDGYVVDLYQHKCAECDETDGLEVDHIVEVCDGGARAWLSNYQLLCKPCHKLKTNKSRKARNGQKN